MGQVTRVLIILISLMPFFTGCAYLKGKKAIIKNRDMAYLQSHETGNLQTPSDINAAFGDELIIPPASNQSWDGKPPSLTPPGSLAGEIQSGKVNPATLKQSSRPATAQTHPVSSSIPMTSVTTTSLVINQDYEQAWVSLATLIPNAGYKILNENKDHGLYYIADLPSTNGKIVQDTAIYQLHLTQGQPQTTVTLTDNEGNPTSAVITKRVLGDLHKAKERPQSWF